MLTETHKTSESLMRHVPASAGEGGSQLVEVEEDSGAVVHLQTYRSNQRRFVVAADAKGEITVFKENGTLHGTAQVRRALPPSSAIVCTCCWCPSGALCLLSASLKRPQTLQTVQCSPRRRQVQPSP